jgi:acyl-CoA oxidase
MLVARGLLTDYKDHFGELDPREMVTFVAAQAIETVVERLFARKIVQVIGDAVPTRDEHRNLRDREHQLDLFRWREGHITASVAQRFKRGLDEGFDPFEVFRAVQDHAASAASAHIDTFMLESLMQAINYCEDAALETALTLIKDLYVLHNLEAGKGFFQEHGRLSSPRTKAITREVNRLCNEVRQQAGEYVDAFGIPDEILAAPIAVSRPDAV